MNKMPKKKSHTVRRLLSYVGRGYLIRFFLVLVCILVSAVASVAGSIFLGALIDNYITPLLAMENPVFTGLLHALLLMACLYVVAACCAPGLQPPDGHHLPGRAEEDPRRSVRPHADATYPVF